MLNLIFNWLSTEPFTAALILAAVAGIFVAGSRTAAINPPEPSRLWVRRVLSAAVSAVMFLGVVWGFRTVLANTALAFETEHGRSDTAREEGVLANFGSPIAQEDLSVYLYREVSNPMQQPRENPDQPPIFVNETGYEPIRQNNVAAFSGLVEITPMDHLSSGATLRGYQARVYLLYDIVNDSNYDAEAQFQFHIPSGHIIENSTIYMDGTPVDLKSGDLDPLKYLWTLKMQPQEHTTIEIFYSALGSDFFTFFTPDRLINQSEFRIQINQFPLDQIVYPGSVIPPTEVETSPDGSGSSLTWKLDHALTGLRMGVRVPQPEPPQAKFTNILRDAPEAITLLAALITLTLLMAAQRFRFADLALILAAYGLQFIVLAASDAFLTAPIGPDSNPTFLQTYGSLAVGALFALALALAWSLRLPRPARVAVFLLVVAFTILLPVSALVWTRLEQQAAFQMLLPAGIVLYLALLWLISDQKKPDLLKG